MGGLPCPSHHPETTPAIYADLELPFPEDPSRPYVVINMVVSVDGVSSIGGKASGIGGAADRRAMRALRAVVDAVMVGAGTLRAERMNLGLDDPSARQPLAVIVAGDGPVPIQDHLTRSPKSPQQVLVLRPGAAAPPEERAQVEDGVTTVWVPATDDGRVDLRYCLELLRREYGVDRLLVEGGPALNAALMTNDLADELFLTLAPKLIHTHPTRISNPATRGPQDLKLLSLHEQNGEIFLRYAL